VLGRIHSLAAMANDRGDGVCEFLIVPAGRPEPPSCDRDLCRSLTLVLFFDAFLVGFVLIFAAAAFPFVFVFVADFFDVAATAQAQVHNWPGGCGSCYED
jgi:hypothetical protein